MPETAIRAGARLAGAEATGKTLQDLPPGPRPATIAAALAIQDVVLAQGPARGWMVGPGEAAGILRTAPLRGDGLLISPARIASADGLLIEAEVALRLCRDQPGGIRWGPGLSS